MSDEMSTPANTEAAQFVCFCGTPQQHTERIPSTGEDQMFLCPKDPRLSDETREAVERCVHRLAIRRDAARRVAAMDPREVAHLRAGFERAEREAAEITRHSRPGHMCLDCSQGF